MGTNSLLSYISEWLLCDFASTCTQAIMSNVQSCSLMMWNCLMYMCKVSSLIKRYTGSPRWPGVVSPTMWMWIMLTIFVSSWVSMTTVSVTPIWIISPSVMKGERKRERERERLHTNLILHARSEYTTCSDVPMRATVPITISFLLAKWSLWWPWVHHWDLVPPDSVITQLTSMSNVS